MWDLSCPDWAERIRTGRSLIPDLPLDETEAQLGLEFFDELQLPDVIGFPSMRTHAGDWFRRLVRVAFGSWLPDEQQRMIRDFFVMVPKGSSKTTYSAGLSLTAMMMNRRPNAEALFAGPTQKIAATAYEQAVGMIEASAELKRRFRPRDHISTIEDLSNGSNLRIKTFDVNVLTGGILIFALLDEIHLLGRMANASRVMRQIRGGLEKTPEGFLVATTTQSDEIPAGLFSDELKQARKIRDGVFRGKNIRPMLPILYEYPPEIAKDPAAWMDPENWWMVMPNLGKSIHLDSLARDWESERAKGEHAIRIWASQHLNIEIGVGIGIGAWPGAEFWERAEDDTLTLDSVIQRSEVVAIGVDGGGLDDLFGASVLGREIDRKRWLSWSTAWAHLSVLTRRKSIAAQLQEFAKADVVGVGDSATILPRLLEPGEFPEMSLIDDEMVDIKGDVEDLLVNQDLEELLLPKDVAGILLIVAKVKRAGKLAAVAIDMEGPYGELIDALGQIGVTVDEKLIAGIGQGYRLMHAIKSIERKLANGTMLVARSTMMRWCVGNIKIEPTATAIRATKQNAGDAKIDPAMALMDAGSVMQTNPSAGRSVFDMLAEDDDDAADADEDAGAIDMDVLTDPQHPKFAAMRDRYNAMLAAKDTEADVYV